MTSRMAGWRDRPLARLAAVEHLVAERRPVLVGLARHAHVGRHLVEDPVDVGRERLHLVAVEHLREHDVAVALQVLAMPRGTGSSAASGRASFA